MHACNTVSNSYIIVTTIHICDYTTELYLPFTFVNIETIIYE